MEYRERLFSAVSFIIFLLALGTLMYMFLEGWQWYDALFFSTSTITTVGYGDLVPHTEIGRLFTVLYMLIGVGTALYAFTIVAEHYFEVHNPAQRQKFKERVKIMRERHQERRKHFYQGLVGEPKKEK